MWFDHIFLVFIFWLVILLIITQTLTHKAWVIMLFFNPTNHLYIDDILTFMYVCSLVINDAPCHHRSY